MLANISRPSPPGDHRGFFETSSGKYFYLGRQTQITDAVGTRVFSYKPDTLQLDKEAISGLNVGYQYEPNRNLKTQVRNQFGGATVSQYD